MKKLIVLLSLALSASVMASTDYKCGGTEPFWDLSIKGNTLSFNVFDNEPTKEEITSRVSARGLVPDFAFVVKTANATATIVTGECSDGMSETVYEKHIMYTSGDEVLYGCCNPTK